MWTKHTTYEFAYRSVPDTMTTMSCDADVANVNIPTLYGGSGTVNVTDFYQNDFVPCNPPDILSTLVSRTVDTNTSRLVDEMILTFTHTTVMPWILPGIPPTNRSVSVPAVAIIYFDNVTGLLSGEHIFWDQASVLNQIGLLNATNDCSPLPLPITGAEESTLKPIY